jgi:hypothetical protein
MLSRTPSSFSERMKSSTTSTAFNNNNTASPTLVEHADLPDIPPSSPFQPEVPTENTQVSPGRAASPSRFYIAKQGRKSPTKAFDIHCDDLAMDMDLDTTNKVEMTSDGFAIPALPMRRASEDTVRGYDLSLQDIEVPPTSKADEFDDFNDDLSLCDAPTVVSEDTCFSTFSAVPNADMTLFASLGGNRTSNHIMAEMVRSQHELICQHTDQIAAHTSRIVVTNALHKSQTICCSHTRLCFTSQEITQQ